MKRKTTTKKKTAKPKKTKLKEPKKPKKKLVVKADVKKKGSTPTNKIDVPDDYTPPRKFKIVGYCPKCDMFLSKNDFVSKMIFECPCGVRKHKRFLRDESKMDKKRKEISAKQYLKEAQAKKKTSESHYKQHHAGSNVPDISIMDNIQE